MIFKAFKIQILALKTFHERVGRGGLGKTKNLQKFKREPYIINNSASLDVILDIFTICQSYYTTLILELISTI